MEAILIPSSPDQSLSPYKQIQNQKKNTHRHFISRSPSPVSSNNIIHGGGRLFLAPPLSLSSSYSFPPPSQQPPLLPLPITKPYNSLPLPSKNTRGLSCSPTNRKYSNRIPKKSKPSIASPKKEVTTTTTKHHQEYLKSENLVIASINRLGPEPEDLPKNVYKVLSSSPTPAVGNSVIRTGIVSDLEKFSGSVFTLSPPPSSLPLPTFSLRPKLSCNAEAAAAGMIDAGATDNLRRLLRLR